MNKSLKTLLTQMLTWIRSPRMDRASGNVYFVAKRTDTNVQCGFGIGSSGTNHGVWSDKLNKWLIYGDDTTVYVNDMPVYAPKVLWTGAAVMNENQTLSTTGSTGYVLSESISSQAHGIILAWSAYSSGSAQNYNWEYQFIPKTHISSHSGAGINHMMASDGLGHIACKYVYVSGTSISGNAKNDDTGTVNGVTYDNSYWVLREVIGV